MGSQWHSQVSLAVGAVPKRPPITAQRSVTHDLKRIRLRHIRSVTGPRPNEPIPTPAVDQDATLPAGSSVGYVVGCLVCRFLEHL